MPQYECQLRHLLPLLAELKQRTLSGLVVQHLRDPLQHLPILVTDLCISSRYHAARPMLEVAPIYTTHSRRHAIAVRASAVLCHAPVVMLLLLLCYRIRSCRSLSLGILVVGLRVLLVVLPVGLVLVWEDSVLLHDRYWLSCRRCRPLESD